MPRVAYPDLGQSQEIVRVDTQLEPIRSGASRASRTSRASRATQPSRFALSAEELPHSSDDELTQVPSRRRDQIGLRLSRIQGRAYSAAHNALARTRIEDHILSQMAQELPLSYIISHDYEDEYDEHPHTVTVGNYLYAVDTVVENQRGWSFMGYPFFSDRSLLPWDPVRYTIPEGQSLVGGLGGYALPNLNWDWVWKRWYVAMSGDVDDQGWRYAWRFGSKTWYGTHVFFRSFVRRRVWKRLRRKKLFDDPAERPAVPGRAHVHVPDSDPTARNTYLFPSSLSNTRRGSAFRSRNPSVATALSALGGDSIDPHAALHTLDPILQFVAKLQSVRLDRERIHAILVYVSDEANIHSLAYLNRHMFEVLDMFEFIGSRSLLVKQFDRLVAENTLAQPAHIQAVKDLSARVTELTKDLDFYGEPASVGKDPLDNHPHHQRNPSV